MNRPVTRRALALSALAAGGSGLLCLEAPRTRALAATASGWLPANRAIVFYSPHQDDETISMGMGIRQAVAAGKEVHLVLVTDGGLTGATAHVNERIRKYDAGPPRHHVAPLDERSTSQARTREFVAAARALGVPAANIHLESVPGRPGTPTRPYLATDERDLDKFSTVINTWTRRFPDAAHATMSWLDWHPDHYHLGEALDAWARAHGRDDVRFFQSPLYARSAPTAPQLTLVTAPKAANQASQGHATASTAAGAAPLAAPASDGHVQTVRSAATARTTVPRVVTPRGWLLASPRLSPAVVAAARAYAVWKPAAGRFGIGWASVRDQLLYTEQHPRSWVHLGSSHWASARDRAVAEAWIATYRTAR